MQFDDVVLGRRSIRGYKPDPVPRALIEEIIGLAMRAPSSMNTQPWNFYVLTGEPLDRIRAGNTERNLAGIPHSREFRTGKAFEGAHRDRQVGVAKQLFAAMGIAREDKAMRQDWVLRGFRQFDAPVCVIVTYDRELADSDDTPFDCGAVTTALVHAAWSRGLGAVINSQGIMQSPVVREHAGIADDQVIMKAVALGWERKRGKLHELNRLLRGARDTTFISLDERGVVVPQGVRYVITLDADTRLPHDTVRRLIGKMAHPLNQAHFDSETGRVVDGYGILQPRITPAFPIGGEGSLFQRVFSSMGGIDPYASAISDVYQDLFGEGSYAGKGIYDIDAVEAALTDRIPEGALLSHDLFEGVFARAGLASDVTVVEEFPDRYDVSALRHHRWARGDWQLLPWILGLPPSSARSHGRARTPVIGRWKMLDNLRRSLSPIANLASLSAAWFLPSAACAIWIEFVLATTLVPPLIPVFASLFSPGVRGR